jgi:hypothetical protein
LQTIVPDRTGEFGGGGVKSRNWENIEIVDSVYRRTL